MERIEILLNDISDDDFRELFHASCEAENVYPEYETDGSVYYSGMPEVAAAMLEDSPENAEPDLRIVVTLRRDAFRLDTRASTGAIRRATRSTNQIDATN